MGLQNQLSDVSSESIIVSMAVLVGKSVSYLHSLFLAILHNLGLSSSTAADHQHQQHFNFNFNFNLESSVYDVVGSGLASLIVLCDQLNLNRACSYRQLQRDGSDSDWEECVVCLNRLEEGDHVRRLACRHVFHRDCFDGWLNQLNFSCPLCRAHLDSSERVDCTRRRVAGDLLAWFPSY